jgi:hypothetical protein
MKNTKIANINVYIKDLFTQWLIVTKQFNKLSRQEIDILSLLLFNYYKLKKEITNEKILWKILFDYDIKNEIKKELKIKDPSFQNALTSMRKKGVIKDNKIVRTYIPDIENGAKNFKVIFNFNIIDG